MKKLFLKNKEIILYVLFGAATTAVNVFAFGVCDKIGISTSAATIIAWVLSVLFAYATNKIFVFESREKGLLKLLRECGVFFASRLATGALDLILMVCFVDLMHLDGLLIKLVSNVLVIILNYVLSKILVFRKQ